MSTRIYIDVPDVQAQLALGYDRIRVFRSSVSTGPFIEVTAAQPAPARLVSAFAGPYGTANRRVVARVNQGPDQPALIDQQQYDGGGRLLTARLRLFDSAAQVPAVTGGNETDGLVGQYQMTSQYNGVGQLAGYRLVRVS